MKTEEGQAAHRLPRIAIIAALDRNRVIGRSGELPWRIAEDLKRFKNLTVGHPVIMGRRTYESIVAISGKPLPGRDNIIITGTADYSAPGCRVVHSFQDALAAAKQAGDAFVIGGAEIYAISLPYARRLWLTEIDAEFEGDAFFPEFDRKAWRELSRETHHVPGAAGFRYDFVLYER
ncbi:MAG: dihydrofolate reductase [Betaproteobacteria bacterium]|nr:dihydrofolate reductase [Betaproteobacteria bacterium]